MKKNTLNCAAEDSSHFERLSHAYRCLQNDACPSVSAATLASIIFVGVAEDSKDGGELTYLSMTLVKKITSSLMARSLPADVATYFVETLNKLIHEMDLMPHLVSGSPLWRRQTYAILIIHQDLLIHYRSVIFRLPTRSCPIWLSRAYQHI